MGSLRHTSQAPPEGGEWSPFRGRVLHPSNPVSPPASTSPHPTLFLQSEDKVWTEEIVHRSARRQHPLSNIGSPILHPSGGGYIRDMEAYEGQVTIPKMTLKTYRLVTHCSSDGLTNGNNVRTGSLNRRGPPIGSPGSFSRFGIMRLQEKEARVE